MKKVLSVLKLFCTLLAISAGVKFFQKLYQVIHYVIYGGVKPRAFKFNIPEGWNNGYYYFLIAISLMLTIYLIYQIIVFRKVIFNFSKDNVFTKENSNRLRKVGKGLMIYAIVILCFAVVLGLIIEGNLSENSDPAFRFGYTFGYTIGTAISKVLPIFVVALFVQFISFLVVKGNVLQEENDLTI